MPKRLVDGEALWTSRKIKQLPSHLRFHYANWLPLAEANGVFEADPELIQYKVYAFLAPEISTENVQDILAAFAEVGLVHVWQENGKTWGYFNGIDKSGRLPYKSQLARGDYKLKQGIPNPPTNTTQAQNNRGLGLGLGLGIGLGEGIGLEDEMSLKQNITDKAREILHVRIFPGDANWSEVSSLARVYGAASVVEKFTEWAETTEHTAYPLTAFLREADGLLQGTIVRKVNNPASQELINDLAVISNGAVTFDRKQAVSVASLLDTYSADEVKSAFREFYAGLDDFTTKFGAKHFVEKAEQFLVLQRRRAEELRKTDRVMKEAITREQAQAALDIAEADKRRQDEAAFFDPLLDTETPTSQGG